MIDYFQERATKTMTQRQRHSKKKKIFIVDDHPIVREGLTTIINHDKDFEVCGEADEPQEALKAVSELRPDVVIVDITLKP